MVHFNNGTQHECTSNTLTITDASSSLPSQGVRPSIPQLLQQPGQERDNKERQQQQGDEDEQEEQEADPDQGEAEDRPPGCPDEEDMDQEGGPGDDEEGGEGREREDGAGPGFGPAQPISHLQCLSKQQGKPLQSLLVKRQWQRGARSRSSGSVGSAMSHVSHAVEQLIQNFNLS